MEVLQVTIFAVNESVGISVCFSLLPPPPPPLLFHFGTCSVFTTSSEVPNVNRNIDL